MKRLSGLAGMWAARGVAFLIRQSLIPFGVAFLTSVLFLCLILSVDILETTPEQEGGGRFVSPLTSFEDNAKDTFFAWRKYLRERRRTLESYAEGGVESNIAIVYIDQDSLDYFKEKYGDFPWPRTLHAQLLRKLMKAGVKAVGFDLLFFREREGDRELVKAAREFPLVTFACKWDIQEQRKVVGRGRIKIESRINGVFEPSFPHTDRQVGFVDTPPDLVKRKAFATNTGDRRHHLSFALNMFTQARGIPPGEVKELRGGVQAGSFFFPTEEQLFYGIPCRMVTINFSKKGEFTAVSYHEVFQLPESELREAFKEKIVLVGGNAEEMPWKFQGDLFGTPLGPMNGVEIHAHALATYLSGNPIVPAPDWLKWTIFFLPSLVIPGMIKIRRGSVRILLFLLFVAALLLLAFFSFSRWSMDLWVVTPMVNATGNLATVSAYTMSVIEKEKARIKKMFSGYLSPKVVDLLVAEEMRQKVQEELAGKKETVTIFYSDIRGFTTLSENLMPEEVVHILNDYFEPMVKIVHKYEGYLDKFIGDCIMAVFSAPFPKPDDSRRGVLAALEMQEKLEELRERLEEEGREPLYVGMGLNTGRVILGNIGSSEKMDYTVIGDAVNVASRLYAMAKPDQILISEFTYREVEDLIEARALGPIQVKGRKEPVVVYEVTGKKESP